MIRLKSLITCIAIPLIFGFISRFLGDSSTFELMNKPSFAPPGIVFPIVWTILYILMGISSYMIYTSDANHNAKKQALVIYGIQLILNTVWTFFFFNLNWYLFSFWWIILIIVFVILMIYNFYRIKPIAAYIQIPYLLWLIFASILAYNIYLLN